MDKSWKEQVRRLAFIVSLLAIFIGLTYLAIVYFFPFLFATLISFLLQPFVNYLTSKWRITRGPASLMVLFSFSVLALFLSFFVLKQLYEELGQLLQHIPYYIQELHFLLIHVERTIALPILERLQLIFPFIHFDDSLSSLLIDKIRANLSIFLQEGIKKITTVLTSFIHLAIIFLFVLLTTYFMTKDYEKITRFIQPLIPKPIFLLFLHIKRATKRSIVGLLKVQVILALITGGIAYLYLLVFRFEHPLIVALILMILELLPYLGIGLFLLPWILFLFLTGNYVATILIASLYIALLILRQIIEPKLLAGNLGLHPLVTIFILFLSMKFFGAIGLFLTPILLVFVSSLYHADVFRLLYHYVYYGRF